MKILILEDNQDRIEKFKQLFKNQETYFYTNVIDAYHACMIHEFKVLFLDHDLGGKIWVDSDEENTGYEFVKLLTEKKLQNKSLIYIHSSNPIGANRMLNYLLDYQYDGIWHPFHLWKF